MQLLVRLKYCLGLGSDIPSLYKRSLFMPALSVAEVLETQTRVQP